MSMDVQETFLKAYDSYADAIFRHCYFRLYQPELAKDLVQQTFTNVWKYLSEGHEVENVRALLYRTANNLVIDEVRKRREAISLDTLEAQGREPGHDPRTDWREGIDRQQVLPYLMRLEEDERDLVVLRYVDDLSPKEIGAIISESANVVSVRLHRAIRRLRTLIPPYVFPF